MIPTRIMRLHNTLLTLVGAMTLLVTASCGSNKTYTYLQDVELAKQYASQEDRIIKIEPGDRLSIYVGSAYPELAAPFNGGGFDTSVPGVTATTSNTTNRGESVYEQQQQKMLGYLVSQNGEIELPIVGKVRVSGLTLDQARETITRRIKDSKYLGDPRVEVMLSNFRIYLLGAIAEQGNGQVERITNNTNQNQTMFTPINGVQGGMLKVADRESINVLEALAMTGDLALNARVDKVNVIRNINGQYVTYRLNLRSADIFSSPAFNLKQNDIVYVEYRYRRADPIDRGLQLTQYLFTTISSVAVVLALLKK